MLLHVIRDVMVSSKRLKDELLDSHDVADDSEPLCNPCRETQASFYRHSLELSEHQGALRFNQLEALAAEVRKDTGIAMRRFMQKFEPTAWRKRTCLRY